MTLTSLAALFCAVLFCLYITPILGRYAAVVGLVDTPSERKRHSGSVPLVGGSAIFITISLTSAIFGSMSDLGVLLTLGAVLLVIGVIDDFINLPARLRLLLQALVAFGMVFWGNVSIDSVGQLVPGSEVNFGPVISAAFTAICVIGVINAINMIDGIDGLSGTILLFSFAALALIAVQISDSSSLVFLTATVGSLAAFLFYNSQWFRSKATVFLGDAGSTFLGLVLVWFFVKFSQGEGAALSPVSAGWIFGIPLADTVCVAVGRIIQGRSPLQAGRDHFHHILLDNGFSVNFAVGVIATIHIAFISIGLAFNNYTQAQPFLFWGFVAIVILHFFATRRILSKFSRQLSS